MAQVKDFGIGPDETMVRDTARSFLAEHTPVDKLRKLVARDHHEADESAVQPAQWLVCCLLTLFCVRFAVAECAWLFARFRLQLRPAT